MSMLAKASRPTSSLLLIIAGKTSLSLLLTLKDWLSEACDARRYKFTIQTEGTSYSGRLKYLQLCRGVVVSQRPVWQEIHTHLLTSNGPGQNFVEIQDGWVDLSEKIEYYLANPTTASQIADRSYEMFSSRHLTPAAVG